VLISLKLTSGHPDRFTREILVLFLVDSHPVLMTRDPSAPRLDVLIEIGYEWLMLHHLPMRTIGPLRQPIGFPAMLAGDFLRFQGERVQSIVSLVLPVVDFDSIHIESIHNWF
jgi:hypothetical protein